MKHRFLVYGRVPLTESVAASLGTAHDATVCRTIPEAIAQARSVAPTVLVLVGDPDQRALHDDVATFSVESATQALPIFVVAPSVTAGDAIRLLSSGMSGVLKAPHPGPELVRRILDVVGAVPGDAQKVWAALDHRGPAVLRRIARFLTDEGQSAMVAVHGAEAPALVSFADGDFDTAAFGSLSGTDAATALLSSKSQKPWTFTVEGQAPAFTEVDIDDSVELVLGDIQLSEDDSLEILVEAPAGPPPPPPLPELDVTSAGRLPPPSVLIVDDEPELLQLYARAMTQSGARVATAPDGERGFAEALRLRPDIILSDIMMPKVDGWGFLALVRADYRLRETPFILFSCHGDYLANLQRLSAGADDYLEKGLRPTQLVERVALALDARRRVQAFVAPGRSFSGALARTGMAFLLRTLSARQVSGTLTCSTRDERATLGLLNGTIVDASATVAGEERRGEAAVAAALALDDGPYVFASGTPTMGGLSLFFPDVEARLLEGLNALRIHHDEDEVAKDHPLVFDRPEVLAFYRTAAPDGARPLVEALVRGTTPRKLFAVSDASPLLIEAVVKDMLRKHVARFA